MYKIPISGGPHTGKTTLFEALKVEFPNAFFLEEPSESVIKEQYEKKKKTQNYEGIFPWNNYPSFARLVIDKSLELESKIPKNSEIVFQDRSLIDNVGYGRLNEYEDLIQEVWLHSRLANYAIALFCEPVGKYTQTPIRHESPEKAQRTHEYLKTAYYESDLTIVELPKISEVPEISVGERIGILRSAINYL